MPVSYAQACLGASIRVPTVDGEEELDVPRGTPSGKILTIKGKGAPRLTRRGGRGDQLVQVVVKVPKKLSEEEEKLIRQLAELQDGQVADTEKGFLRDFWDRITQK